MATRKYFGTDGVRGTVGEHPITADFMLKLGWAAGRVLARSGGRKVLIGKDTRISGYMFESALEAGLSAAGVDTLMLGPMPTPGIAYLTRTFNASAGIVISASHNPYQDNGIKFFSGEGSKLPDDVELAIEQELDKPMTTEHSNALGRARRIEDAAGRYIEFCKGTFGIGADLQGLKVVLDCANGATYHIAPSVFRELGASVSVIGHEPNGLNINDGVGSTHPDKLIAKVAEEQADLGIAFDGDGDRVLMVDHTGELVTGDELLYIIARDRKVYQSDPGTVVGTLMSNLGLEQAIDQLGMEFRRAKVGDRYILEILRETGSILGGENSGHLICLDLNSTGDGIVSALQVLKAMQRAEQSLHDLKHGMMKYPQTLINVRIRERVDVSTLQPVQQAVREVEDELADAGRVLLRPSGTEPLIRVMVEGRDPDHVQAQAQKIADVVADAI